LWLVYMGFEVPGNDLKSLGQRLPPAKVLARHQVGDNHLLRLRFREPQIPGERRLETALIRRHTPSLVVSPFMGSNRETDPINRVTTSKRGTNDREEAVR
jgi:hypothetical protein